MIVLQEKGRPKGFVKRYEIFMACHTKEDGTYPEEMKERMERMNRAIQKDPMLMDKDLDSDAVAIEYGADGNGHVRGYNGHLNKTNLRILAPFRRVIERERVKQAMLNEVWFRALLGGKKNSASLTGASDSKVKKRWNFVRSFRDKDNNTPIVSTQTESSTCHYIDPSNKHAIAVAATTAAVAKAVVTVAHVAAVVVKLTGGSRRCMTRRVDWVAVRIQAVFRGYLAKKALWVLKGLVKLQALVRGHIMRKKTTYTMRAMQVLVRVQARARARASSRGLHSSYNALSLDRNSQSLTSIESPSRDSTTAQRSTSSVSSGEVQSTEKPRRFHHDIDDEMYSAIEDIPQFYSATSRPGNAKGGGSFTPTKS
ncbi:hypothetical protein GIB67_023425 [Kingdonia uniflora]|uniref:DUF4005 domain-containing protein n=1 Tax=Kingdonia uniflora TaxID=39325 RepID=A0A7J7PAG5_9MAGN|nr:hypothetical protein GIB67_023425 [Kingdonia uniflora]